LLPNQVLTHILLPADDGRLSATYEVRHGAGPDMPLAAAAVTLQMAGDLVRAAKIVLGQVAPVPWISHDAAQALVGKPVNQSHAEVAGVEAVAAATPLSCNQYKVQLAQVAVKRAILMAAGLETGGF
jgi:xanthine dehydrogenase YagS FAD-binding subunit